MKAKYILSSLLLAGCTFFSSCEDNLDISQPVSYTHLTLPTN